ncbi:MAG: sugar ABC transporter substrate-binding protein [Spirochaetaceae bacterium]|jgi:alpha-1,4-digalacturonate transport system substrate-binding protein|nr:sugar ABC transporter substrate-binding protein [Spirochaetaceae bacterium]
MKKIWALFLAVAIIAPVVMAGGQKAASSGKTLKVLLSEEPSSTAAFMTVLEKWAAETGNTVEPVVIPYDDQLTKFPLMAKNKDLPDVVYTTRLAHLYPEEFVDFAKVIDPSIFEPKALEIIAKDYIFNQVGSLPIQFTITIVYYNADAFAKAGLTPPTVNNPWTIEEVFANGRKLQESGGVKYGVAMDFSRARYDNMMYMNGGSMVVKDGNAYKVAINSPQNIEALQTFINANNSGVMPKAIWAGGSTDNPADYFKNGDVGIYFSGSWNYNAFTNDIKSFKWGVMPSPRGKAGRSAILGGTGLAVPKKAPNRQLAEDFIKWLYTNPANFKIFLDVDKGMSSLKGVTYAPPGQQGKADYEIMQAEVANVTRLFSVDEDSYWRTYKDNEYRDYLKQAVNGDLSATNALNAFARELSESSKWAIAR